MRGWKTALAVILFFSLLLGGAPLLIGMNVRESTLNSLMSFVPPESRQQIEIREETFARGWFSSDAHWRVLYQPFGFEEPLVLDLAMDIEHGPLLDTSQGWRMGLVSARIVPVASGPEIRAALEEIPFDLPPLRADLLVGLDQSVTLRMDVDPVEYSGAEGEFHFSGVQAQLLVEPSLAADFELSLSRFAAAEEQLGFELAGLRINSSSERIDDLLAPASARMQLDSFSSEGPFNLEAENLSANSSIRQSAGDGARIDLSQQFNVPVIRSELPVESLHWSLDVREVQSELIRAYYELLAQLQTQINGSAGGSGANVTLDVGALGQEMALILLRNELVIDNSLRASAFGAEHELAFDLRWAGVPQLADTTQLRMGEAIMATEMRVSASLDYEAVMRSPLAATVAPYIQQGFIEVVNGRIQLEASLGDGELSINGAVLPLNQLF